MKLRIFLSCFVGVAALCAYVMAASAGGFDYAGAVAERAAYQPVSANADTVSQGAEKFITDLVDEGVGFLGDATISADKQKAAFRKLLNNNFDMDMIARFSLGRHWRSASQAQRDEYMKLFKVMIVDVYSARFSDYEGQEIEVTGSRKEGERDILVHSLLSQKSGPDVQVDWRVRQSSGRYKVIDVIVEGVSMAVTQRSDFSSVVQRGGGNMEALLAHLRTN
ncbi:MAG: ABC transporter substrate-binding protein [Alphaproteobacteria bacterium]